MFNPFSKGKGKKTKVTKKRPAAKAPKPGKGAAKSAAVKKAQHGGAEPAAKNGQGNAPAEAPSPPPARSREFLFDLPPAEPWPDAGQRLDEAKAALESGSKKGNIPSGNRKKLIEQAMAVHTVQSKLLDDLDEETKTRLRQLAMQKLILQRDK